MYAEKDAKTLAIYECIYRYTEVRDYKCCFISGLYSSVCLDLGLEFSDQLFTKILKLPLVNQWHSVP